VMRPAVRALPGPAAALKLLDFAVNYR